MNLNKRQINKYIKNIKKQSEDIRKLKELTLWLVKEQLGLERKD